MTSPACFSGGVVVERLRCWARRVWVIVASALLFGVVLSVPPMRAVATVFPVQDQLEQIRGNIVTVRGQVERLQKDLDYVKSVSVENQRRIGDAKAAAQGAASVAGAARDVAGATRAIAANNQSRINSINDVVSENQRRINGVASDVSSVRHISEFGKNVSVENQRRIDSMSGTLNDVRSGVRGLSSTVSSMVEVSGRNFEAIASELSSIRSMLSGVSSAGSSAWTSDSVRGTMSVLDAVSSSVGRLVGWLGSRFSPTDCPGGGSIADPPLAPGEIDPRSVPPRLSPASVRPAAVDIGLVASMACAPDKGFIHGEVGRLLEPLKAGAARLKDGVKKLKDWFDGFERRAREAKEAADERARQLGEKLKKAANDAASGLAEKIRQLGEGLKQGMRSQVESVKELGRDLGSKLGELGRKIEGMQKRLSDKLGELGRALTPDMSQAPGLGAPSEYMPHLSTWVNSVSCLSETLSGVDGGGGGCNSGPGLTIPGTSFVLHPLAFCQNIPGWEKVRLVLGAMLVFGAFVVSVRAVLAAFGVVVSFGTGGRE